ncbi:hypothetical protein DPMN_081514 [Dreissena polymorpha]|uniref:Uncharacterized protein n=1 Tax=Dreissena polymorpha TaxID=45954 RepID=A0A9D4BG00_DREPO|nr:hypothetical protein DPMN_081514 [Dreissena polymorpha]
MFSHLISHSNEDDMYIMDVSEVDSVLDLLGEQDEKEKLGIRDAFTIRSQKAVLPVIMINSWKMVCQALGVTHSIHYSAQQNWLDAKYSTTMPFWIFQTFQ